MIFNKNEVAGNYPAGDSAEPNEYGTNSELVAQYTGATAQYWNIRRWAETVLAGGETIGRAQYVRIVQGQERAYYLKDQPPGCGQAIGSVHVTVTEDRTVLGWAVSAHQRNDYYPFGLQNLSRFFGMDGRSNSSSTFDNQKACPDHSGFTRHFLEQDIST